jgi:stage III sporulation protein AH
MLTKKKKIIILSVMLVLLVVTGYLNVVLNNGTFPVGGNINTGNFFATYRTDRQATRNQEISYYDAIVASTSSSAEAKTLAETKRANLIAAMELELVTEGLIKAKGFEDVIVTTTTSSINVIVKSGTLQASQVAQIVEVVQEQTGASFDNIKIIPVE